MKVICIGRNYVKHAEGLNNEVPGQPVFFMKPACSVIKNNKPFFYPDFSENVHHELEIVLRIDRLGKGIAEKFAARYFEALTLGIDFTARDLQDRQKEKGLPWEIAKAFDRSAPVGKFLDVSRFEDIHKLEFSLAINGKIVQKGNTSHMIFSFERIISYVSQFVTLKMGDLIFTGTPAGVGPVTIGDHLEAWLEGEKLLDFHVK